MVPAHDHGLGARIAQTLTNPGLVHREVLPDGIEVSAHYDHRTGAVTAWLHLSAAVETRARVCRSSAPMPAAGTQPVAIAGYPELGADTRAVEPVWAQQWLGAPDVLARFQALFQNYPGDIRVLLRPGKLSCQLQTPGQYTVLPAQWGLLADAALTAVLTAQRLPPPRVKVARTFKERVQDDTIVFPVLYVVFGLLILVGAVFSVLLALGSWADAAGRCTLGG